MAVKLGRMVTYLEELLTINSFNAHLTLKGSVADENYYISTTRVSMATSPKMMVTYLEGLLAIKVHDPLIT